MSRHPTEFFVALESQVWDALVRGDPSADRQLLGTDFVGVYPTGFADQSAHADQLIDGPTVATYAISDPRLIRAHETAVLLCYRADFRRVLLGAPGEQETMFVSSLWSEREGRWWNTFSQDTPAAVEQGMASPRRTERRER
jgi:hypothetical protein